MATTALDATSLTLVDLQKRMAPDGSLLPLVEQLQQRNPFLQSMVWKEGNLDTGHRVSARSALPSIAWVRFNEGISQSKSTTDSYEEHCGMLEGLSSIDTRIADLNGKAAEIRASEDDGFLAQMANSLEGAFFYETTASNPERILGLSARLGSTTSKYGNQILKADANAAGANQSSIWLIGWGERTVYGITPRGKASGLVMEDMGKQRVLDSNSKPLWKYETRFQWHCGLCVEDYRYAVRIANVDMNRITGVAGSAWTSAAFNSDLVQLMIQAFYQVYDPAVVRIAWYCDRKVAAFLHMQARAQGSNSTLSIDPAPMTGSPGLFGRPLVRCMGAPIYVTDALSNAEAVVA